MARLLPSVLLFIGCVVAGVFVLDTWTDNKVYNLLPQRYQYGGRNGSVLLKKLASMIQDRKEPPTESPSIAEMKVLVWVMTQPNNHATKAVAVKETWGKRADKLIFVSTKEDSSLPSIAINMTEDRNHLWGKTKAAFQYVYDHHINEYDWFMKADDDTYVVMENLRYMLSVYDAESPIYFGSRFKLFAKQGYMSGGGGYVLSRAAVRLFVERALPDPRLCKQDHSGAEDAEMGKCLEKVGVLAGDSRDHLGRGRFFPFIPIHHLIKGIIGGDNWYWNYIYYPIKSGPDCCSDTAITFHYIEPDKMHELEYFIYHLKPVGALLDHKFPAPLPPDRRSIPDKVLEKYGNQTAR